MSESQISVLIICPRDLIGAAPYLRAPAYAGVLRAHGYDVSIIEPAAQKMSINGLRRAIKDLQPKIILIGVFPSTLPDAFQTIKMIRAHFPDIKIIVEGYMINASPEYVAHLGADYGLTGDAEFTFAAIVKNLIENSTVDTTLDGLVWRERENSKWNKPAMIKHLDDLPVPAYEMMPIGKYYSASTKNIFFTIFTARGCPYECNFCANISQAIFRYHSIGRVLDEVQYLVEDLGVEYLEFMDLTFTVNKKRTMDICQGILDKGLKFKWACETRVDKVDEELLSVMKRAGCFKITFGVESGSEAIRAKSQKTISNKEFTKVFDMCHRIGIKTMANFILGHPTETLQEMEETISFSKELNPFNVLYTKMIPLPDVEIFNIAVKEGVVSSDIWLRYMKGEVGIPVYIPSSIARSTLDKLYTKAQLQFYLRPKVIWQYLPLLTDLKFAYKSFFIFWGMAMGSTKYK